jgi:splicing factor 1
MTRAILFTAAFVIASLTITPLAEAKKGGGGNWKGPPPHGNAWGNYKNGWPGYPGWYGGYPMYSPPAYYGSPPPPPPNWSGFYSPGVARPVIPEPLPPPPPPAGP